MALGLPSISVQFIQEGITTIQRGARGIVGMIVKEASAEIAPVTVANVTDIPEEVSADNKQLITNALLGNTNAPLKLELYVLKGEEALTSALNYFENTDFDYLCYPAAADEEKTSIVAWVKSQRDQGKMIKAVLADEDADHEGIINVTQGGVVVGEKTYSAGEFTARVAGLIAGTDLRISTTYASLPEVDAIPYESRTSVEARVGKGEFALFREAGKVKVARGVNSLTTTSEAKGTLFQKIKTCDIMDIISNDIRRTARDNYLGKYSNSYDNKCLLVTAIQGYMDRLAMDGLVEKNSSVAEIDTEAQRNYLKSTGVDVTKMSDQQIKEAYTDDKVFIKVTCKLLDAIEAISVRCFI